MKPLYGKISQRRKFRRFLTAAGSCLMTAVLMPQISAYAEMENSSVDEDFPIGSNVGDASDLWLSLVKVIFVLIVIIGLILLIVKFLAKNNQAWFGKRSIRVVSGVQLAQNKSLQIVEIGDSIYLLGVGEDVRLVDKINDPEQVSLIREQLTPAQPEPNNWRRLLSGIGRRTDQEMDDPTMRQATFQEIFQQRMSRVNEQNRKMDELLTNQEKDEKERSKL